MNRREVIALLGGAAVGTWPFAVRAQQASMPVIGFLGTDAAETFAPRVQAFRKGLGEAGYVEGRSIQIEYRWADGRYDRLPVLAADLVARQPAVIATGGSQGARALKAITTTIPVVFQAGANPVEEGLVASLNRPAGNLTGVTTLGAELVPKRLELLNEFVPGAGIVAVLVNSANGSKEGGGNPDVRDAAKLLGVQVEILNASSDYDFDVAFLQMAKLQARALVIAPDALLNSRSEQLAALSARYGIPAIGSFREFPAAGGLMSYGGSITDVYRLVGGYTGRILGGEKPQDLPVIQSSKIELIINLKTAKALGLAVPLSLLGRADEIIE